MDEPTYYDPAGRPYRVRNGVSEWLDHDPSGAASPTVKSAGPSGGLEYASLGRRFGAAVIDFLVVTVIAVATALIVGLLAGGVAVMLDVPVEPLVRRLEQGSLASKVFAVVAWVSFFTVAAAVHGSTPGKMMLGMTVRSDRGGPCSLAQAYLRSIYLLVDGLVFCIPALMSMKTSRQRKRIGDRVARTVVVMTRSVPENRRRSMSRFVGACALACLCYSTIVGFAYVGDAAGWWV
jgi:uncharacterized RDD family membrane protein YckC